MKMVGAAAGWSVLGRRPGWTNALNLLAGSEADEAGHFYLGWR